MINTTSLEKFNHEFEQAKLQLAKRISFLFTLVFGVLVSSHLFEDFDNLYVMSAGLIICSLCYIYTLYCQRYQIVYWIFSIAGVILTGFALNFLETVTHYADFIWMFASVVVAYFGINKYVGVSLLIVCMIFTGMFCFFNVNDNIVMLEPRTDFQKFSLFIELSSAFCSGIYVIYLVTEHYRKSQQYILETNTSLLSQNETISSHNEEKTVLVKEIHHRVKNNLQIISSLLRMQSNEIENEEEKKHFQEAVDRVQAMALIHKKLYQGESLQQVNLVIYFDDLIKELVSLYNYGKNIEYEIDVKIDKIGLKSIVPLGLLVNELVSNSLKHAFTEKNKGKILLRFYKAPTNNCFIYEDSGSWTESNKNSFGLELIDVLTEQLDGKSRLLKEKGKTRYEIKFGPVDK